MKYDLHMTNCVLLLIISDHVPLNYMLETRLLHGQYYFTILTKQAKALHAFSVNVFIILTGVV